jgi:hypothetical protein
MDHERDAGPRSKELFRELRALELPLGHYVITLSGPLAIRGIREANDLDLMVDDELWEDLAARYSVSKDGTTIEISPTIEVSREASSPADPSLPTVEDQIRHAEQIDGLPFVCLDHLVALKRAKARKKDRRDIALIRKWLAKA